MDKKLVVKVCDFPTHKHDRPAVTTINVDVCSVHAAVLGGDDRKVPCPECDGRYAPGAGMAKHRLLAHGVPAGNGKTKDKVTAKK